MSDDIKNIRRVLGPTLKYVDGRIDVVNPGGPTSIPPGTTGTIGVFAVLGAPIIRIALAAAAGAGKI